MRGITQRQAAEELEWSLSKVVRIENGQVSLSVTGLRAMIALYEITDRELVEELTQAARGSKGMNWWTRYNDVLGIPLTQCLGFESVTTALCAYNPVVIPDHLQTHDYAKALLSPQAEPHRRDLLVALRAERQERLLGHKGSGQASFVIDEAALRRQIGSPAVMGQQLEHLIELSARPRVEISVLPLDSGAHYSTEGGFILLDLADDDTLLYLDNAGSLTAGVEKDVASFRECFETISGAAIKGTAATELIDRIKTEVTGPDRTGSYAARAAQIAATSRHRTQDIPPLPAHRRGDDDAERDPAQPFPPHSPGAAVRLT
jgi:hypothetical protein